MAQRELLELLLGHVVDRPHLLYGGHCPEVLSQESLRALRSRSHLERLVQRRVQIFLVLDHLLERPLSESLGRGFLSGPGLAKGGLRRLSCQPVDACFLQRCLRGALLRNSVL